jgi:hypothetical protein
MKKEESHPSRFDCNLIKVVTKADLTVYENEMCQTSAKQIKNEGHGTGWLSSFFICE